MTHRWSRVPDLPDFVEWHAWLEHDAVGTRDVAFKHRDDRSLVFDRVFGRNRFKHVARSHALDIVAALELLEHALNLHARLRTLEQQHFRDRFDVWRASNSHETRREAVALMTPR